MESILVQADLATSEKNGATVVLDIESLLVQAALERCSGSPKMNRALSRKWSYRAEKWSTDAEEEDVEEPGKRSLTKVNSQLEALKQLNKAVAPPTTCVPVNPTDSIDSRNKRFSRLMTINPRKILFIFATASSMGTLILIYCTLAINRRGQYSYPL
ncbi:hypothetical protein HS088_TW05G00214 [Tripterygium wilfordii]|uniref:Uncharacterized protein n=1 Tax=Tripterygium wilfordii TaxID=458696 RepID=A0A7J7DMH9_TRIWF|nr:uncharacterized protein LOC119998918 [Tripterygium wilfordii]KAF5747493.1 hypothetical protein HS088_TW05G00214 [Tripterygium wilfordii]